MENPENKVFDSPRGDSSPQSERGSALADVLADVYRYVLTRPRRSERARSPVELRCPEDAAHAEQRKRETEQEKGRSASRP